MSLTWRDGVATLLLVAGGAVVYAREKGLTLPLLTSWRLGSAALLTIGLGTCIVVGAGGVPEKNTWTTLATVLGVFALVAGLLGIVTNKRLFFVLLAGSTAILWIITTLHHVVDAPGGG